MVPGVRINEVLLYQENNKIKVNNIPILTNLQNSNEIVVIIEDMP